MVTPLTWLTSLRSANNARLDEESATNNPAVKLFDFFTALWAPGKDEIAGLMSVDKAVKASPALKYLEPVRMEWLRKWVREWIAVWKA